MNTGLNESQRQAVFKAISADDFYIVHGPPGTGKTVTGVEILCQAKSRYSKLLATADSNGAVDNIALGLLKYDVNVVRLGQPFK
ncbi:IGHMBP2 family helicase, partial [Aduncisulcus paluster]